MKSVGSAPQVTPDMLKGETLYNITDVASESSKASMAVVEFQGQGYLPSDLSAFESNTNLPEQAVRRVQGGDKRGEQNGWCRSILGHSVHHCNGNRCTSRFLLAGWRKFRFARLGRRRCQHD